MKNYENEAPKAAICKALSKFENSKDRIFKAIGELETTIEQVESTFAPILKNDCKNECAPKTDPVLFSDFDIFIENAEERIRCAIAVLNNFCERSAI